MTLRSTWSNVNEWMREAVRQINPVLSRFGPISAATLSGNAGRAVVVNSTSDGLTFGVVAGSGSVTSVSVTTANGVSGTVATATTTPAITVTLGAITPSSVAATGTVTGSNLSNINTGDQTTITGNAGTATTLQTARLINGVSFNGSADITVSAVDTATPRLALTGGTLSGSLAVTGNVTPQGLSVTPAATPTLPTNITQFTAGETSNNPDYKVKLGYYNDGAFGSSLDSTVAGVGGPLKLNPSGGAITMGGPVSFATGGIKVTAGAKIVAENGASQDISTYTTGSQGIIESGTGSFGIDFKTLFTGGSQFRFYPNGGTALVATISSTGLAVAGALSSTGQASVVGLRESGTIRARFEGTGAAAVAGGTGPGVEIIGADGVIQGYNRSTPGFNVIALLGSTVSLRTAVGERALISDTGISSVVAVTVPDDAYSATTWDANLTVPTKNAVRDKIEADAPAIFARYHSLLDCSGSHTAARAAGTYWMGQSQPLGITGVGTLYPANVIYLAPTDYPNAGALTAKIRLRIGFYTNDVAPGGNYTFGIHPVTRPATSGAAGLAIYTVGAAVAGSTVVATTPAADSLLSLVSVDVAVPAAGHYVVGMVSSAAVAASAHIHISAIVQIHYT